MTRIQISQLMDAESCFNAKKAVELGFADGILYSENQPSNNSEPIIFCRTTVTNSVIRYLRQKTHGVPFDGLMRQLMSIK